MSKKILVAIVAILVVFTFKDAKALYPFSGTAYNEVELGVEGIARICPTSFTKHIAFRDIIYDHSNNSVTVYLQLNKTTGWVGRWENLSKMSEQELRNFYTENFLEAYEYMTQSHEIDCGGDYMLLYSMGPLLKQIEKSGTALCFKILGPDDVYQPAVQKILTSTDIIGDWYAQIDIPQNDLTILLNFNLSDNNNCVVNCRWSSMSGQISPIEESGKAKYTLNDNWLTITFLNQEEVIRTDHVFDLVNRYQIVLKDDKMVIVNNRQFRNVDVPFGNGAENLGHAQIIFGD